MGQRQRQGLNGTSVERALEANETGGTTDLDGIGAMMAGVKRRGVSSNCLCAAALYDTYSPLFRVKIY
jgi:hypothetical protein